MMYLLGRARARYDQYEHDEFYAQFLDNYDPGIITFERVQTFRRKLLVRRIHDSLDSAVDDGFTASDITTYIETTNSPTDSSNADTCAIEMNDFLDATASESFPSAVSFAAAAVIVGTPKTDEFTVGIPLEKPIVGARAPLVGKDL